MRAQRLLLTTSLCAVAAFMPKGALAQEAPKANMAQSTASQNNDGIADIVVTAQRREESAQRAPVVIDTVTAGELTGVSDVRQLANAVPGIQFANAGNDVQTYVRGIGSFNAKSTQESAVAYSLDGVYLFTTTRISPAIYDLARVEVLKGPQGTLYGRNASGGAINLITHGAKLGKFEGQASAEIGNFDLYRAMGAVNVPLSDTLAVRVAGQHVEHSGYLSDGTSDDNTTAGRIRLLWAPSSDVQLRLNFDIAHVRGIGPGSVVYPFIDSSNPWRGNLDPIVNSGGTAVSGIAPLAKPFNHDNQWSTSAQLDWNLGPATLTVLPAYSKETIDQLSYVPGYGYSEHADVREQSYEARLAHDSSGVKWVVGAYYLNVDIDQNQQVNNPTPAVGAPSINFVANPNHLESWAVFGETTVNVTGALHLIGGLRYTWEKSASSGFQNQVFPGPKSTSAFLPGVEPGDFVIASTVIDHAVTWKAGAQYDLGRQSMLFATVSRGFKGGGSFVDSSAVNPVFRPEYVTAYEFGSRNRFFDNTLQANLELFYWNIRDQQVSFVGFNSLNQSKFQTANAANAKTYGADIDIIWRPDRADRFSIGLEYDHATYDNFVRIQPSAPAGTTCPTTVLSAGPPPRIAIDCSNRPMMRTPRWSGSFGYEHTFFLDSGAQIVAGADTTFASSRWTSIDFSPVTLDGSYAIVNAQLSYRAPRDRWQITLWAQNLTKKPYLTGGLQSGTFSRPTINQPRTFGARLQANF